MLRPELVHLEVDEVLQTARSIESMQLASGCIPWVAGGHADPWNHTEAAMALAVGGRLEAAERAFRWLSDAQRDDGWWHMSYRDDRVEDASTDANQTAYVASGLWHHALATGDDHLLSELWPMAERGIDAMLTLQRPDGALLWAREADGTPHRYALLASSACIHLSLRCALAAADHLGRPRPDWRSAADRLAHAVVHRPETFEPKDRWAMDWYYPVLGGALTGAAARVRLAAGWERFVVDSLGCRCVSDRPWITAAETCELILALDAVRRRDEATRLFGWVQWLRDPSGAYWTGATFPEGEHFPPEHSTYTAAAVVLAADALYGLSPASGFFRMLHDDAEDVEEAVS